MKNDNGTRGYEHPLSLDGRGSGLPPHAHLHGMGGPNPLWQLPEKHGQHSWIAKLGFSVPAALMVEGGVAVDPRRLANVEVYCWVCERDLEDSEMAATPCLGDPADRYIPTRSEFRGWPEERQLEWLDSLDEKTQ